MAPHRPARRSKPQRATAGQYERHLAPAHLRLHLPAPARWGQTWTGQVANPFNSPDKKTDARPIPLNIRSLAHSVLRRTRPKCSSPLAFRLLVPPADHPPARHHLILPSLWPSLHPSASIRLSAARSGNPAVLSIRNPDYLGTQQTQRVHSHARQQQRRQTTE